MQSNAGIALEMYVLIQRDGCSIAERAARLLARRRTPKISCSAGASVRRIRPLRERSPRAHGYLFFGCHVASSVGQASRDEDRFRWIGSRPYQASDTEITGIFRRSPTARSDEFNSFARLRMSSKVSRDFGKKSVRKKRNCRSESRSSRERQFRDDCRRLACSRWSRQPSTHATSSVTLTP